MCVFVLIQKEQKREKERQAQKEREKGGGERKSDRQRQTDKTDKQRRSNTFIVRDRDSKTDTQIDRQTYR